MTEESKGNKLASINSDESLASDKLTAQPARWAHLTRRSPKLPPIGETILIEDDPEFVQRLTELGIAQLPEVAILPRNFNSAPSTGAFVFEEVTSDLQVIGRRAGISIVPLVEKPAIIRESDILTIGAVIVIGSKILEAANTSATLIEFFQRLGNFLRGRPSSFSGSPVEVVQEIIVTDGATAKRLTYRGAASDLHTVVNALKGDHPELDV